MTREEFSMEFSKLTAVFGFVNDEALEAWFDSLENLTASDFAVVVKSLVANWRPEYGKKFPVPADAWRIHESLTARPTFSLETDEEEDPDAKLKAQLFDSLCRLPAHEKAAIHEQALTLVNSWWKPWMVTCKPMRDAAIRTAALCVYCETKGVNRPKSLSGIGRETT